MSVMGFTALLCQPFAGDIIDRATVDRRAILIIAAFMTAGSAMAVLFVHYGNQDHTFMYITKIAEGIASSFIAPVIAALTLASFGPDEFDSVIANNVSCVTPCIRVLYALSYLMEEKHLTQRLIYIHFSIYVAILEAQ